MRSNPVNAFEHTSVPYGDDGRMVCGIIARCGWCEAAIPLPVNTMATSRSESPKIEWNFIAQKLEAKGWRIGKTRTAHLCPKCFGKARSAAIRKSKESIVSNNVNGVQVVQENTRVLTRDDRRIIFEKLNEVYVDDKVGYGPGWTDEKVATNLGVPRAWVRVVRDENFGDEVSNDDIRQRLIEAQAGLVQIKAIEPEMRRLLVIADKIERSLAEIQKVLR